SPTQHRSRLSLALVLYAADLANMSIFSNFLYGKPPRLPLMQPKQEAGMADSTTSTAAMKRALLALSTTNSIVNDKNTLRMCIIMVQTKCFWEARPRSPLPKRKSCP
ncbi:unnamed protein product, partial [Ectocarpus sp. 12 AP-2014]